MAQVKYRTHNALKVRLHRCGFKGYGSLATLLLDLRFELNGFISAKHYYGSLMEVPGLNYKAWADSLIKKGFLIRPRNGEAKNKADFVYYEPGPELINYLNKEKIFREEMASMHDLHRAQEMNNALLRNEFVSKAQFEGVLAKMNEIEETLIACGIKKPHNQKHIREQLKRRQLKLLAGE